MTAPIKTSVASSVSRVPKPKADSLLDVFRRSKAAYESNYIQDSCKDFWPTSNGGNALDPLAPPADGMTIQNTANQQYLLVGDQGAPPCSLGVWDAIECSGTHPSPAFGVCLPSVFWPTTSRSHTGISSKVVLYWVLLHQVGGKDSSQQSISHRLLIPL